MCLSVVILKDVILYLITSMMKECSKGGLNLGVSFACPLFLRRMVDCEGSLSGFSICMRNTAALYLCLSTLETAVKYPDWSLTLCSVSGSCVFCLPGWGKGGAERRPWVNTPLLMGKSLCCLEPKWLAWIHKLGTIVTPLSTTPHVPCAHMGYTLPATCKEFAGQFTGFGQNLVSATLQGWNKEWLLGMAEVSFRMGDLIIPKWSTGWGFCQASAELTFWGSVGLTDWQDPVEALAIFFPLFIHTVILKTINEYFLCARDADPLWDEQHRRTVGLRQQEFNLKHAKSKASSLFLIPNIWSVQNLATSASWTFFL